MHTKQADSTSACFFLRTISTAHPLALSFCRYDCPSNWLPSNWTAETEGLTPPKSLSGQENGFCGGVSRNRATEIPDPLLPSGRPAYALSFTKASTSPCYHRGQRVGLRAVRPAGAHLGYSSRALEIAANRPAPCGLGLLGNFGLDTPPQHENGFQQPPVFRQNKTTRALHGRLTTR